MIARIAAVVLAALLGVWALMRFVYVPHRCNAGITAAEVATSAAERTTSDYDRLVRARRNLELLAGLRESCPTEVRVPMLTGANLEFVGRPEDALASYKEALQIDHRPEIYVEVARMQLELGQVDEAVASYVTATRFSPLVLEGILSAETLRRVREQLDARP
jgi:tetratricopeptide (TPR) repeat protein